jgi:hypothetical protein
VAVYSDDSIKCIYDLDNSFVGIHKGMICLFLEYDLVADEQLEILQDKIFIGGSGCPLLDNFKLIRIDLT